MQKRKCSTSSVDNIILFQEMFEGIGRLYRWQIWIIWSQCHTEWENMKYHHICGSTSPFLTLILHWDLCSFEACEPEHVVSVGFWFCTLLFFHASNPCFIICFWFPLTVLLANQPWCYWVCIMSFLAQESITSSHSQKHTLNKEYKYHLVKPLFDAYLPFVTLLKIGLSFACLCTGK